MPQRKGEVRQLIDKRSRFMQSGMKVLPLGMMIGLAIAGLLVRSAMAQTETVLYNFCSQTDCGDGEYPNADLRLDDRGNIYGTANNGGSNEQGLVFELTPEGEEQTALFDGTDGANPGFKVILGDGSLFGTTGAGGYGYGSVFKVIPGGKLISLYSFCRNEPGCADGSEPGWIVLGKNGDLYGTTFKGGAYNNGGTVFKLTQSGQETVLYSFCSVVLCADGAGPGGAIALDKNGNLYGATAGGGANGHGTMFKLTPQGEETVLYNFCTVQQPYCGDGDSPSGLVFGRDGNLYGVTAGGGANAYGAVYRVTLAGQETVLYSFCSQPNCADGYSPNGVVFDKSNNLYGTTLLGGANSGSGLGGTVFKLTPAGQETVLHSFCSQANCADGNQPSSSELAFDKNGNLYGTTHFGGVGGAHGAGTVFRVTP
jgi:uncharacterized repeat protein (TIGR03803 family)